MTPEQLACARCTDADVACTCAVPPPVPAAEPPVNNPVFCSFCGKNQKEVAALVAGPCVYICTECLEQVTDTVAAQFGLPPEVIYSVLKARRLHQRDKFLATAVEALAKGPVAVGPKIG